MFDKPSLDFFAAINTVLSVDTLIRLGRGWGSFWDGQVTVKDRFLLQRVAVFILVPVGVFFHEVGHAIATWQVGGTVVEFSWRVFWGYVIARGDFLPAQSWWIAFSGNLVSILLGFLALLGIFWVKTDIGKELLYTFGIVQLVFSLVIYPLFSFSGFEGDWLTIYDFQIQPYAQITLVIHAIILLLLWWLTKKQLLLRYANIPSLQTAKITIAKSSQIRDKNHQEQKIIKETERLIIREFCEQDIDKIAPIFAHPQVMKFSPTPPLDREMTAIKVHSYRESYAEWGYGKWAVITKKTHQLIGYCGIGVELIDGKLENELGYRFAPEFWGQGIATEAARACIEYGFNVLNLDYILGIVEPENQASVRVLEKIGMKWEGETIWLNRLVHVYRINRNGN
ncbi:M50 family metallopeptidase [Calothrix sp. NIES-3974]|uniref:M50 family metallopeptidase n=1 Tax=Calothrix sp. NIES-3974 TaxID=2005462 RepID=UPI000B600C65|nr:M50 family metallopeptidase [Calothrix sp. NIES-3974]BAZ05763.1 hypothetical protein NIES3974_24170 [Calothrix sp. NIES-3974]